MGWFIGPLVLGPQGILATNALSTLIATLFTFIKGDFVLGIAGLAFSAANFTQAIVYGKNFFILTEKQNHIVLSLCEFSMALGLALVAINAGYSAHTSFALIVPVIIAGFIRSFKSHWLPPDLAYIDMMFMSVMTFYQAIMTGNGANALSRVLVFCAQSRLAVLRARNEGKTSVFEIERFLKQRPFSSCR